MLNTIFSAFLYDNWRLKIDFEKIESGGCIEAHTVLDSLHQDFNVLTPTLLHNMLNWLFVLLHTVQLLKKKILRR